MRLEASLLSQCLRQPEPPASHAEAAVIPLHSGLTAFTLGAGALGLCRATWSLVQLGGLCYPALLSHMLCSAEIFSWLFSVLLTKTPPPAKYLELHSCCKKKKKRVKAFKLRFANYAEGFIKWIFLACHKNIKPHSYFYPFNLCKINWRHFTLLSFASLTLRN